MCLQLFMMGVTGDLIAMSKEVSDPVFMWTTGWGFFFGGFLFTREFVGPVPRSFTGPECHRERTSQGAGWRSGQA